MTAGGSRRDEARGMMIGGIIVLGVGTLFLLQELDLIPSLSVLWPVFPIIVGLAMIVGSLMKLKGPGPS